MEATHTLAQELARVRRKGVKLRTERGQLRYQAPKGVLTSQELDRLRQSRAQIVTLLEHASKRAPLTFSQQMYWNMFQLGERGARRQVASATRLRGPLQVEALERSVAEAVRRHDALRT